MGNGEFRHSPVGWLIALVVAAGSLMPVQIAINSRLREAVGSPVASALISFLVGSIALLLVLMWGGLGGKGAGFAGLVAAPWWAFLGGLCGAIYVCLSIVVLPRLGVAVIIAAAVLGQQVASLLLDSCGWLGVPRVPLTGGRLAGALLLMVGLWLLQRR
jgi:bacterial/archaeal transporter family-2 protein